MRTDRIARRVRRLVHPGESGRRFLSGACGAFLLLSVLFSSLFVAVEADHDCAGQDCPVCLELQVCLGSFQLTGTPVSSGEGFDQCAQSPSENIPACDYRAPATTLRSLDVRWNE